MNFYRKATKVNKNKGYGASIDWPVGVEFLNEYTLIYHVPLIEQDLTRRLKCMNGLIMPNVTSINQSDLQLASKWVQHAFVICTTQYGVCIILRVHLTSRWSTTDIRLLSDKIHQTILWGSCIVWQGAYLTLKICETNWVNDIALIIITTSVISLARFCVNSTSLYEFGMIWHLGYNVRLVEISVINEFLRDQSIYFPRRRIAIWRTCVISYAPFIAPF